MGCNPGCRVVVIVEEQRVTACSAGDRPGGLGGAVYLLVRSLVRVRSFVNVRSSMLSIGGRGMLSNAVHPCWIVQVPSRGVVVAVIMKGYHQQWFSGTSPGTTIYLSELRREFDWSGCSFG